MRIQRDLEGFQQNIIGKRGKAAPEKFYGLHIKEYY